MIDGLVSICEINPYLDCPECEETYDIDDLPQTETKQGYNTKSCDGCGYRFGYTQDIRGDAVAFELD